MSSNAFASSRPRARHQPANRRRLVEHPRFLKLVQELARLNEIKIAKQQQDDEAEGTNEATTASLSCPASLAGPTSAARAAVVNAAIALNSTSTSYNQSQFTTSGSSNTSNPTHEERCPAKSSSTHHPITKQPLLVDQNNPDIGNSNNSNIVDHSSITLNNNNINTNNNNNNHIELNSINNNQTTNIAQDENRSKRKRSTIDNTYGNSRKGSSSESSSGLGPNKKIKSSTDNTRPLSPSFTKCPICLLDCMDRDPSFTNTCFHLFCYVCIENWSKNKSTCPLCRTKFTKIIFNIKSAKSFEEKVTVPPRRDEDETFLADRHSMLEHLSGMHSNISTATRNNDPQEVQFIFEHFGRNPSEVLMPPFFINNLDHRAGEPVQFNGATSSANYNPNVPTNLAFTPNYSIPPNYAIALSFQQRIPPTSAMASAYPSNNNLTNSINDPNSRCFHRNNRYIYGSNGDVQTRVTRATSSNTTNLDPPLVATHHGHQSHLMHHNHEPQQHHHHNTTHPIQAPHQPQVVNPHAHHHVHQQSIHHVHHHHHQPHLAANQQQQQQQQQQQLQSQHQQTQTPYQPTNLRTTIEIPPRNARVIGVTQSNLQVPQIHPRSYQNGFARHRQANYPVNPTQLEHANNILDNMYRRMPDM